MKKLLLLLSVVLMFISCSKESIEICGEVTGGGTSIDRLYGDLDFYLLVDGQKVWVDEKTYDSYYVGDWVCLQ